MTLSIPNASSSHDSNSSHATKNMPNTGMHIGPFPWPKPPFGVPPNETHGVSSPYAPVARSSDVGARVPNHASQAGPDGHLTPPAADVSGGNPPPQHPSAAPLYPGSSVGEKRAAENLEKGDAKRIKTAFDRMKDDPLFKPVLNRLGHPKGTYRCSKDGMIINPESYLRHIQSIKHLGYKKARFQCPGCFKTYLTRQHCKRHFNGSECEQSAAGGPPPSFLISEASASSASDAPATVPAVPFTYTHPNPASMSQNTQIALPPPHVYAAGLNTRCRGS
ncbi:hypothetical protein EDD22DRAFT_947995 [Suillus occidentalis]|nr:hypothetical protein EDD22DRAFT_947995 [Suillus occidentalis]